jgi:hypothetical protein
VLSIQTIGKDFVTEADVSCQDTYRGGGVRGKPKGNEFVSVANLSSGPDCSPKRCVLMDWTANSGNRQMTLRNFNIPAHCSHLGWKCIFPCRGGAIHLSADFCFSQREIRTRELWKEANESSNLPYGADWIDFRAQQPSCGSYGLEAGAIAIFRVVQKKLRWQWVTAVW